MTEEKTPPESPPRKRRWLKRIGFSLLTLFVLLVIFHRPLFFEATRYFILRAAKQQNLDLDYKMSGSIFTTLSVENLRAKPTEPGPIERLEIGTLNLQYSLVDLIRKGLPAFLKMLELRDVYIVLAPGDPLPPDKEAEPQQFKFPALFPDTLNIENVNVIIQAPTGTTTVEGAFFSLLPDRPGVLKIQTLDLPGVRRWTNISGATTFRDRNLLLTDLSIGPEIALRQFQLDASKLEDNELLIGIDGAFFDAPTRISAHITDLNNTNHLELKADIAKLAFDPVGNYFGMTLPVHGSLDQFSVSFNGAPEAPNTWVGDITAGLSGLVYEQQILGEVSLSLNLADERARLVVQDQLDEKNHLKLEAEGDMPKSLDDFIRMDARGRLDVWAPELGLIVLPEKIAGDLQAAVDFSLEKGKLRTRTVLDSTKLVSPQAELNETHLVLVAEKDLTTKPEAPIFQTLVTRLDGKIARLRFQDYITEEVVVALSTREDAVALEQLSLKKAANSVALKADYLLPKDFTAWEKQPLKLDVAINAPELQAFLAPDSTETLQGTLTVTGKAEAKDQIFNGEFLITGRDIKARGLPARTVDGKLEIVNNEARLSQLDVVLNDINRIQAGGTVQLAEPYAYQGNLDVQLKDLSLFQPLLVSGSNSPALAGSLTIVWSGTGNARALRHDGTASIDLTNGRFDTQKNLTAHLTASYSPDFINIPDISLTGDLGQATLSIFWKDNRLEVSNLAVRQKKLMLLEGSLSLPLHLSEFQNFERLIPNNEPLKLALVTRNLDLRALSLQLGQKPAPLLGTVNLDASAEGTLDDLLSKLNLRATGIQSTAADDFAPADISLDVELRDDRARINGSVKQKLIQPLTITGDLPFDSAIVKQKQAIDPQTPVDLRISLPSSSLAFLSTLVPAIRQSRGTAAVDVKIGGTIGAPSLSGNITSELSALRFTDPSLPPINAFGLRLNFTHDRIIIERCTGGIAGGSFSADGNLVFSRLDNPVFNLRLGTKNALVMQNDDLSVRATSDISVKGPLNAGNVTGTIFVTRSRFFKNIDILPIGLPGRPAPQPPQEPTVISFRDPPLRNWKFDIAIRTADPFLVQSNLARGTIVMNLRLGGTGLEPWMEGSVLIENLVASLPFSRLNVNSGLVSFIKTRPFIPQLDLRATSTIRDYSVTVFITGPVTEPEALFTSDPPLLQADIVSLLATGMTTSELSRDPNALAGRAVVLLFQKLYRSVFQRNQPPSDKDTLLSRIQFDIGVTDPKTGRQSAALGIPLSDQIMMSGGLDVGGNFRGQLKYLIRFK